MRAFFLAGIIFVAMQAVAAEPMQVGGVPVDGRTDLISVSDVRGAIAAFKESDSRMPAKLTVISKDLIHGYIPQQDMGWITVKRDNSVGPDKSQQAGWFSYGQDLPEVSEALHCIQAAQQVYVFPVATPLKPHRDEKRMRLLDDPARKRLAELLGTKSHWFIGFNDLMYPDSEEPNLGFVFRNGNDELILFFFYNTISGTFNGEHMDGTLDPDPSRKIEQGLQEWEAQYAQPELKTHD